MELLRKVQAEQRPATADEQRVLARWGGWGAQGVAQVLDENRVEFEPERTRLRELLSPQEYAAARLTTINAHYTDAAVVEQVWRAVEALGFVEGRVLEPGCGAGAFIGYAPAGAAMTGVELDPSTAAIAGLLYPEATIRAESFATTRFPAGHFDAAVGNVPFADVALHDPRYNPARLKMHNHFIVKSLQMVRPGGVVAVLTSRWTMDATNPAARRAMSDLADLVCAVRLPSKTHWRAAGTEAVTDVLILRRREPDRAPAPTGWLTTVPAELTGPRGELEMVPINSYWSEHPQRVLGEPVLEVGLHGFAGLAIRPTVPLEQVPALLGVQLEAAAAEAQHAGLGMTPRSVEQQTQAAGWVPAVEGAVDGQLIARRDGSFAVIEDGGEVTITVPKTQAVEVRALIELRDTARSLIAAEAESLDDSPELDQARDRLAMLWRSYVARYGPINRFNPRRSGRTDPETGEEIISRVVPPAVRLVTRSTFGTVVSALEVFDELAQTAQPASLLQHRLIVPRQPVQGVETAADGLAVVLDSLGRVDIGEIAALMGVEPARAIAELGDQVFQVPGTDQWQTRAHYLSGDVRTKLDQARAAEAESPGHYSGHVAVLEAVLPEPIGAGDIAVRLGAVWIPDTDHQQFLAELLNDRHGHVEVTHLTGSQWDVKGPKWGVEATTEWGTRRMPAGTLMGHLIAQRAIVVHDTLEDGSRVLNPTETEAAQEKARLMQERFAAWVWEEPERATRLLTEYNRRFNSTVLRDYTADGQRLTLPGLAKSFTPRRHQLSAVARMINEPCVGLFHDVGAGKTAEMIIGATELRRLGLIRKPAVVVPNNMLMQFATDWLQLYPQAKILAASTDDLTADNRRRFVARVATNDWDGVIMTRTAFERLTLTPEHEADYQDRQLDQVREALIAVKHAKGESVSVKRLEKAVLRAEEKLKELRDRATDPDLHFEYTGIDYLVVDEMHQYKNLATTSAIPDANILGSKRATDLHAKVDYLRHTNGNRVLTGATATPLANSITEMYVVQRYLDPDALNRAGLTDFDSWAATFGEVVTGPELAVAGGGRFKVKNRFARFTNVPELLAMFHAFGDVKTAADLDLPTPLIEARPDGKRIPRPIVVPASDQLLGFITELGRRSDNVSYATAGEDNMLNICTDGRKAALSMRLVDPTSRDNGKIDTAADELARVWKRTRHNRYLDPDTGQDSPNPGSLQIVFCDLATPSNRWNAYHALRDALIARGLPPGSIRFIHDATSDVEKAKLFAACRNGHVAVLIGSTEKMGVGTNIQTRAVHLMDLDAPWRPADVAQRHGRILRQGNQNPEIAITQVITENSFDAYMWQTLERKAAFIDQIMSGRGVNRTTGDIGDATLNAAEAKALSSGNPLLLDLAVAEQELARLTRLERAHTTTQHTLATTLTHSQQALESTKARIERLHQMAARTVPTHGTLFALTLASSGRTITDRAEAAAHLDRALAGLREAPVAIGTLGGHHLTASAQTRWDTHGSPWRHTTWSITGDTDLHTTTAWRIGSDGRPVDLGTIARLEHLVAGIPTAFEHATTHSEELQHTIAQARRLHGHPFTFAAELASARLRYADLTRQLTEQTNQTPAWEVVAPPAARPITDPPPLGPGRGRGGPAI
ncbi:MAG: hypothetical protein U0Q47_12330 [Mycobacterium sp.]